MEDGGSLSDEIFEVQACGGIVHGFGQAFRVSVCFFRRRAAHLREFARLRVVAASSTVRQRSALQVHGSVLRDY